MAFVGVHVFDGDRRGATRVDSGGNALDVVKMVSGGAVEGLTRIQALDLGKSVSQVGEGAFKGAIGLDAGGFSGAVWRALVPAR
jgi:hypothetical protein